MSRGGVLSFFRLKPRWRFSNYSPCHPSKLRMLRERGDRWASCPCRSRKRATGGKAGAQAPISSLVQSRSCLVPCALGCCNWPSPKGCPLLQISFCLFSFHCKDSSLLCLPSESFIFSILHNIIFYFERIVLSSTQRHLQLLCFRQKHFL